MLSVVIPTLNAAASLGATIRSVAGALDVIVADGGSTDGTCDLGLGLGARVVSGARGRGAQLAHGAQAARGDWLLFLHADTALAPGWAEAARSFMEATGPKPKAAAFRFALDDPSPAAKRLERMVAWRNRVLGLPYGDQGLLIGRAFYERLGGFRPMPLMEDVELVRRIGRRRLVVIEVAAITSAERFRQGGYVRRPIRNLACLGLYFLGVPPRLIARLYG